MSSQTKRVLEPPFFRKTTFHDSRPDPLINPAKSLAGDTGLSIKIYCDDGGRIDKAWKELQRKIKANLRDTTISDNVVKTFTYQDLEKIRKLERDFDIQIMVDQRKGNVRITGHTADIPHIQEEIRIVLKDIKDRECKGKI